MGTVIHLITKEVVTVNDDLLTVQKKVQEEKFVAFVKKSEPHHTVIINTDTITHLTASTS